VLQLLQPQASALLNQAVGILARLYRRADVAIWAIVGVAVSFLNSSSFMRAFWASTSSRAEDHECSLLLATRAICITFSPWPEGTEAHLWARLSVASLGHSFKILVLALLAAVLGLDTLDEPSLLHASTACIRTLGPVSQGTLAINRARRSVVTSSGVAGLVAVRAWFATIRGLVSDGVLALSHTIAASCGARPKFRPVALAILCATVLIASEIPGLAICVWALLATELGRHRDRVLAGLNAHSTTVAAISAFLVAGTIWAPLTFAIDWARVSVARLVLDVLDVFALATTELCLDADDILPGLRTTTAV